MIERFEPGKWYRFVGDERGPGWVPRMDFVLDGYPRKCVSSLERKADLGDGLQWNWGNLSLWKECIGERDGLTIGDAVRSRVATGKILLFNPGGSPIIERFDGVGWDLQSETLFQSRIFRDRKGWFANGVGNSASVYKIPESDIVRAPKVEAEEPKQYVQEEPKGEIVRLPDGTRVRVLYPPLGKTYASIDMQALQARPRSLISEILASL